jgi:predicted GNAT superfamily acetyltransferase
MGDAFNAGDRSDRLEVEWDLESDRVRRALREDAPTAAPRNLAAPPVVYEQDGEPVTSPEPPAGAEALFIQVPQDYHGLREKDGDRARRWREALGDALESAFAAGFVGTQFVTGERPGYRLEPR